MHLTDVIIKPVVTEKGTRLNKDGTYLFYVNRDATKIDVKNAVRMLYGISAVKVNMIVNPKKIRMAAKGRPITKRHDRKKAVVTLKGRKSIDVFHPKAKS